ncbi:MAG: DUF4386 domain-containing protein [Pseudomonadota bacterium]
MENDKPNESAGPAMPSGRIAGLCYLVIIAGALFGEAVVRGQLVVSGDPAATARNIIEQETLYRIGLGVALAYIPFNIPVIWVFARAFRARFQSAAFLMTLLFMAAITIEASNAVNLYVPAQLLLSEPAVNAQPEALRAMLAFEALRTFSAGVAVSLIFFGLHCLTLGALIIRTRLIPWIIGAIVIVGGLGYLLNSFAFMVAPEVADLLFPFVLLPAFVGELSLAVWLTLFGFSRRRWREAIDAS